MGNSLVVGEILGPDLLVILAIVMVLFGSSKIPKLARSMGQASHEFHRGLGEGVAEEPVAPTPAPPQTAPAAQPAPAPESTPATESTTAGS